METSTRTVAAEVVVARGSEVAWRLGEVWPSNGEADDPCGDRNAAAKCGEGADTKANAGSNTEVRTLVVDAIMARAIKYQKRLWPPR